PSCRTAPGRPAVAWSWSASVSRIRLGLVMAMRPQEVSQRAHQGIRVGLPEFQVSAEQGTAVPGQPLDEDGEHPAGQLRGGSHLPLRGLGGCDRPEHRADRLVRWRETGVPMGLHAVLFPHQQAQGRAQAEQEEVREPQRDGRAPFVGASQAQGVEEHRDVVGSSGRILGNCLDEVRGELVEWDRVRRSGHPGTSPTGEGVSRNSSWGYLSLYHILCARPVSNGAQRIEEAEVQKANGWSLDFGAAYQVTSCVAPIRASGLPCGSSRVAWGRGPWPMTGAQRLAASLTASPAWALRGSPLTATPAPWPCATTASGGRNAGWLGPSPSGKAGRPGAGAGRHTRGPAVRGRRIPSDDTPP